MSMHCPYCHSTQVHRVFVSHQRGHHDPHAEAGIAKLGLGRIVIKNLLKSKGLIPSPWMAGLAEVLLNSLLHYLLESQRLNSESGVCIEFYCEKCQRSFYP